jgi:hypothetical protein
MMEAARTSETVVNFYHSTRHYNPEDSHLRTHRRENLKSYMCIIILGTLLSITWFPSNMRAPSKKNIGIIEISSDTLTEMFLDRTEATMTSGP